MPSHSPVMSPRTPRTPRALVRASSVVLSASVAESDNDEDNSVFDPLSEGRGSEAKRLTLLMRGRVIEQLKHDLRRRDSYLRNKLDKISESNDTASSDDAAQPSSSVPSLPPFLSNSSNSMSPMSSPPMTPSGSSRFQLGYVMEDQSDGLDELSASSVSINRQKELIFHAVLSLWINLPLAAAFRQLKEASRAATDPSSIPSSVNLNDEAKRILMLSEAVRAASDAPTNSSGDNVAVKHSRKDTDLLVVWAKQMHSKTFRGVDDAPIREVMRYVRFRMYQDGESLFYEGDLGDVFYILFHGTVAVFVGLQVKPKSVAYRRQNRFSGEKIDASLLGKRVFTYRTGESFGETAMFTNDSTRTASAIAVGPCQVCELSKDVYKRTLRKYHQKFFEQAQKLNFLQRVPLFQTWQRTRLSGIADVLEKRRLNYGDHIVTENVSVPSGCYLVLAGSIKLYKQVEVPSSSIFNSISVTSGKGNKLRKRTNKARGHMNVELQTLNPGDVVALEALLEPEHKAEYTAVAASASAEVYLLRELDARNIIGVAQSAFGQKIRSLIDTTRRQHQTRLSTVKKTFEEQELIKEDVQLFPDQFGDPEQPAEATKSPKDKGNMRSPRPRDSSVPLGLAAAAPVDANGTASFIRNGAAPYLPNIKAANLFADSSQTTATQQPSAPTRPFANVQAPILVESEDISVVSSPKMLSTCVKKFIFEHSDTLAIDYVDRLKGQFPPPPLTSRAVSEGSGLASLYTPMASWTAVRGKQEREEQRVLEHQMKQLYDNKMHWDARSKAFVLTPLDTNLAHSTNVQAVITARSPQPPANPPPLTAGGNNNRQLYQQLKTTQESARKIVENHLRKVSQRQTHPNGDASFLHFF